MSVTEKHKCSIQVILAEVQYCHNEEIIVCSLYVMIKWDSSENCNSTLFGKNLSNEPDNLQFSIELDEKMLKGNWGDIRLLCNITPFNYYARGWELCSFASFQSLSS